MDWNYKKIRKQSFDTAFRKNRNAWFSLVVVAFLFSFIGASNGSQTTFIDTIDSLIGANDPLLPGNIEILKEYIVQAPIVRNIPFITSDLAMTIIDSASKSATWVLKLLSANIAYFMRNQGEVAAVLLFNALLAVFIKFFILNVSIVGRNRFVMENRFSEKVSYRRIFAVFDKKTLWNVIKVMFCYKGTLLLWYFTIIGGIYKEYQYCAVPYLLAENPEISWRDAKRLSAQMTKGCKLKTFLTQMSYLYIWILKAIPFVGLLVCVPLEMTLNAEIYFTLRNESGVASPLFIEKAFDEEPYIVKEGTPEYVLSDLSVPRLKGTQTKSAYSVWNFITLFFVFCLIGWLWEVGLHIFRDHELVNRGTMYGPWIPIYGVGGTAMVLLLDRFKGNKAKLIIMEVVVCGVLEYASSFLLDFMFNSSYWNYKDMLLNINGRICFAGLTAFALGGLAAIYYIAPAISGVMARFSKKKQIMICVILCAAFVLDIICCLIFGFNSGAGVGGKI